MQGSEPSFPGLATSGATGSLSPSAASERQQDQVLFAGHARHTVRLPQYLLWTLVSIVFVVGGVMAMQALPSIAPYHPWIAGVVGLLGLGWTYLRHITSRYQVSTTRVEFERGIVGKNVDSLELWRVLDVRFKQSLWDRIVGDGKVILVATDRSHPELVLHGLPQSRLMFERLRDAVQNARHRGRPTEFVGEGFPLETG